MKFAPVFGGPADGAEVPVTEPFGYLTADGDEVEAQQVPGAALYVHGGSSYWHAYACDGCGVMVIHALDTATCPLCGAARP